jgi:hypothetical protein
MVMNGEVIALSTILDELSSHRCFAERDFLGQSISTVDVSREESIGFEQGCELGGWRLGTRRESPYV